MHRPVRALLVLASAASLLAGPLPAQDSAEVAAIEATARDYIEGWYTGDADRMERALHPHLAKRFMEDLPVPEDLRRRRH